MSETPSAPAPAELWPLPRLSTNTSRSRRSRGVAARRGELPAPGKPSECGPVASRMGQVPEPGFGVEIWLAVAFRYAVLQFLAGAVLPFLAGAVIWPAR